MSDNRNIIKYKGMQILEKLGLLRFGNKLAFYADAANPYNLWHNSRYWLRGAADGSPIPPLRLIYLVAGTPSISWFLKSGQLSVQSMRDLLRRNGYVLQDFKAILDFGCGCARVLRHLRTLNSGNLYGTDYNDSLILWSKRNLPFARFSTNGLEPPTEFPDDTFDFIYGISVLTHLPEMLQFAWMNELSRVLKPGGLLYITTHGEYYMRRLNEQETRLFLSGELIVKLAAYPGTNFCTTFHPESYVRHKLASQFVVVDFAPQGAEGSPQQDAYLLKKTGDQAL